MREFADFELDIPFKGERSYVHSASLYDAAVMRLGREVSQSDLGDIRLIFEGFARKQLKASQNPGPAGANRALLTFMYAGKKFRLHFVETEKENTKRVPYPEEQITERCRLDLATKRVTLANDENEKFSLIENIVAINKTLHERLFAEHRGKWVVTEIRTVRSLLGIRWQEVAVQLQHCLGIKLTRATVSLDGVGIGNICFSLKQ